MTSTPLRALHDVDTEHWLKPVAIVSLSGVTYHLTLDEAFELRRQIETACRATIRANHAEAMRSLNPAVYGD